MQPCPQRRINQDAHVRIRINHGLLKRVDAAASRDGVSLSEFLRTVLRREVEHG
jgi:predicted DNA binding CopG/RHH family protein